jgi:hypothetical protein
MRTGCPLALRAGLRCAVLGFMSGNAWIAARLPGQADLVGEFSQFGNLQIAQTGGTQSQSDSPHEPTPKNHYPQVSGTLTDFLQLLVNAVDLACVNSK